MLWPEGWVARCGWLGPPFQCDVVTRVHTHSPTGEPLRRTKNTMSCWGGGCGWGHFGLHLRAAVLARRGASSGYALNYRRALAAEHKHYAKLGRLLRLGAVPWDQGGLCVGTCPSAAANCAGCTAKLAMTDKTCCVVPARLPTVQAALQSWQ